MSRLCCSLLLISCLALLPNSKALAQSDTDGNGFRDDKEQELVESFVPCMVLHRGDQGVSPEPVEIMTNHIWASLYGGWDTVNDYLGEVRAPDMDGTNYSNIDNEHHGIFDPRRLYSNTYNCGAAYPVAYELFHFDFGGRGEWCGAESRDHNDQPTEQTGDDWYTVYRNGNSWSQPGSYFPNTVYAHPFTFDQNPGGSPQIRYVIQYWFFYPFDDWNNNHEGDWEHINVIVSSDDPATATLQRVVYYFHERYVIADRFQTQYPNGPFDCYVVDGKHPVVFVGGHGGACIDLAPGVSECGGGEGSHGSYPMAGGATRIWDDVEEFPIDIGAAHTVYQLFDRVDGDGIYIPWFEFVDDDRTDSDGVVLVKEPGAYNYNTNPQMSWLKADILWGRPLVWSWGSSHGKAHGNSAPHGPYHQWTWDSPYATHQFVLYSGEPPYSSADLTGWSPPATVSITAPGENATVSNVVSIYGTIHFSDNTIIDVSPALGPDNYSQKGTQAFAAPIVESVIGKWNTGTVSSGPYFLRVTSSAHGTATIASVRVNVSHRNLVVAPSGGDFTSIWLALNDAQMGDTLSVQGGIYSNTSTHPTLGTDKIVYVRAVNGSVEIRPYLNSPIVSIAGPDAHATFDGITFKRVVDSTSEQSYGALVAGSNVTFKNCDFVNMQAYDGYAINATGASNVELDGCTFEDNKPFGTGHVFSSVVSLVAVGTQKPTGSFVNCTFKNNSGHAVQVIYDPANPLQNTEPKPYFQGCKFTNNVCDDNVVTIRNSLRTINFFSCLFADNKVLPRYGFPEAAIFANNASVWLDNCTIARNTYYDPNNSGSHSSVGAVSINTSGSTQPVKIEDSIIAFNEGPVVNKSDAQMPTNVTLTRSIAFGNTPPAGSGSFRDDAHWVNAGTNVIAGNPAFCDAANGDYELYAFSPAAPDPIDEYGTGLPFTERVGAYDVGCVPNATGVTVAPGSTSNKPSTFLLGCPKGEAGMDHLIITATFSNLVVTRPLGASEISLQPPYLTAGLVSSSTIRGTTSASTSDSYSVTLDHPYLSGFGENQEIVLYLDGHPLQEHATVDHRSPDVKSAGAPGPAPCSGDLLCPDGKVTNADLGWFFTHYPTGANPGAPYSKLADYRNPIGAPIGLADFSEFTVHFAGSGHKYEAPGDLMQTVGSEEIASTHVVLGFTEEYVTALDHRLYVDVTLEDCADKRWCLFAIKSNRSDLTLSSWEPTSWAASSAPFSPVDTENGQELYFGVIMINDTDEATRHLGRLSFNVSGSDPVTIGSDQFVLTVGEIEPAGDSNGESFVAGDVLPVYQHMSGVSGRILNLTVQQVFHNSLAQNYPNPFNPRTTLAYSLHDAANVSLTIYDVAGRRVRELVNEHRLPGAYKVVWDGRDEKGTQVSSGVYFYKLVAGSFTDTKKMIMLK